MDEPAIIRLVDPDDPLSKQAFALYQTAFPIEELDPVEDIKKRMRKLAAGYQPEGYLWRFLGAVSGGRLVGLSMYTYYRDARLGYLWYLATQPELRGQGLGAWLFRQTRDRLMGDAVELKALSPLGMCWEVERPEDGQTPDEVDLRWRRINFYRRVGAILLDQVRFVAPPITEGQPPMPYHLMYLPVATERVTVDKPLLGAVIDTVLRYGYLVGPESEYYRNAIASLDSLP